MRTFAPAPHLASRPRMSAVDQPAATPPAAAERTLKKSASCVMNQEPAQVPTAQNRWRGSNRSGWSNPEYDRLSDALATTLDRSARDEQVLSALRILHDQVPYHTLYFGLGVLAYDRGLRGRRVTVSETNSSWDIHTWDWQ